MMRDLAAVQRDLWCFAVRLDPPKANNLLAVGWGLHAVSLAMPILQTIWQTAGAAQLLWLARQLATSAPFSTDKSTVAEPITFLEAAAFKWINFKPGMMVSGPMTTPCRTPFGPRLLPCLSPCSVSST